VLDDDQLLSWPRTGSLPAVPAGAVEKLFFLWLRCMPARELWSKTQAIAFLDAVAKWLAEN